MLLAAAGLAAQHACGDVRVPNVFGDHMVLQRELPVPVWGWADPGEKVTVTFAGASATATADAAGNWSLKLPAMPANAESRDMTVAGKNTLAFKDVLVGEVWLCGCSNSPAARYQDHWQQPFHAGKPGAVCPGVIQVQARF